MKKISEGLRQAKMNSIQIILPFRLPTWNQLLAMNRWERQKVVNWIREFVSTSIHDAGGSQIRMGSVVRPRWTAWSKAEYYQMIQPSTSKRYRLARKFPQLKKR